MDRIIGDAVARGAKLLTGGERIGNQGYFYSPTVLKLKLPLSLLRQKGPYSTASITIRLGNSEQ